MSTDPIFFIMLTLGTVYIVEGWGVEQYEACKTVSVRERERDAAELSLASNASVPLISDFPSIAKQITSKKGGHQRPSCLQRMSQFTDHCRPDGFIGMTIAVDNVCEQRKVTVSPSQFTQHTN